MPKKRTRNTDAPTKSQTIAMKLFMREQPRAIAKELGTNVFAVLKEQERLGKILSSDLLTPGQAAEVSCVNERRIRALCVAGRVDGAIRAGGGMQKTRWIIQADGLREFLKRPRPTGLPGTQLLHGDGWESWQSKRQRSGKKMPKRGSYKKSTKKKK